MVYLQFFCLFFFFFYVVETVHGLLSKSETKGRRTLADFSSADKNLYLGGFCATNCPDALNTSGQAEI